MQSPLPFDFITAQFHADSNGVNYAYIESTDTLYVQDSVTGDWSIAPTGAPTPFNVTVTGHAPNIPWTLILFGALIYWARK